MLILSADKIEENKYIIAEKDQVEFSGCPVDQSVEFDKLTIQTWSFIADTFKHHAIMSWNKKAKLPPL